MSVAPHPSIPTSRLRSKKYTRPARPLTNPSAQMSGAKIKQLPVQERKLPPQMRSLLLLQKGISLVTLLSIGAALGIYAWTVYIPKVWDREYDKLQTLQRYERQLLTTNETLKEQLAKQAEKPESGLTNPQPTQSIFLPVSPPFPQQPSEKLTPNPTSIVYTPLAY